MNVDYIRDLNHNYIKVESKDEFFEYQVQMITRNNIEGLLKCSDERIDNKVYFLYEINSKQPFVQVFERQKMNFEAFMELIMCLKNTANNISDFLLDFNSIVLLPEYIYMNPETKKIQLLYLPGSWQDIKIEFHELSRKLLDWIDYKDEQVVTVAYELFRRTSEENYSLEEILENILIEKNEKENSNYKLENNNENICSDKFEEDYNTNIYEFEDDYETEEQNKENDSIMKKISDSLLAAENWLKGLSFMNKEEIKDEEDDEEEYENIIHNVINYNDYVEENISYRALADEETGYGNTVFFSATESKNKKLRSSNSEKYGDFKINIYPFIIGKLKEAVDGVIEDGSVSRIHAKIEKSDSKYYLVDLNSTNGTYLNGQLISPNEKTKLQVGDKIQFGLIEYSFENQ